MKGCANPVAAFVAIVATGCFFKPEGPTPTMTTGDGGDVRANYVFVTSQQFSEPEIENPADADMKCQSAADEAGLGGTYMAWVSTSLAQPMQNAKDRFPPTARGWIRTDGKPFADQLADIVSHRLFYPPRYNEHRVDQFDASDFVYTGTHADGTADEDCLTDYVATYGVADATGQSWTRVGVASCSGTQFRLYCFGVDRDAPVAPDPAPPNAMRAFITESDQGISGVPMSFDARCDQDGKSAFGSSGVYRALVAYSNQPARSVLPINPGGWYRRDHVKLVDNEQFTAFQAPLNVATNGDHMLGFVWAGAPNYDALAISNCEDWTSNNPNLNHFTGDSSRSERGAFEHGPDNPECSTSHRLYCFQTQ